MPTERRRATLMCSTCRKAANAPRRYASRVTPEGPEALLALSPLARSLLPPLPYPGASEPYRAEWDRLHAISSALVRDIGALVVHVPGAFHVARGTGIPERIADYRPGTRLTTVVITEAEDIDARTESEHGGLADFVVLTATKARR
ncbi:MAG TPA: hypothetical protein VM198_04685 [Longimicrobiales bacterium]|nr:hypothetical protein [Longimicrobiales bacterium]